MDVPADPPAPKPDLAPPGWQLRVLNGPARGRTHAIGQRLGIGRAPSSDLQLPDQEVSRQHARIVSDEHGRHVLEDLASRNGTLVNGRAIERFVLEPHTVITIVETELVYEPVPVAASNMRPVARHADMRTLRSTAEHSRMVARTHAPTTPVGSAVPVWAATDCDGRALVFERPDGGEYEGNLVDDVLEYRTLRAQQLRGGFADARSRQRFESLTKLLRQPPSADPLLAKRAFARFGCWLPAVVRHASGAEQACRVRDIGVDGAQLLAPDHDLDPETTASLAIDVIEAGQPRSIVLAARVAWVDGEFVGLAFAGAPRPTEGSYSEQPARGQRDSIDDRTHPRGPRLGRVSLRLAVEPSDS